MLPLWHRIRLALTVAFALMGVGLLVLAYSLTGRFPGSTVVVLAMIAISLPIGIYCVTTVGGWQRSLTSGARPSGVTGWIIRHKLAPVLPIGFMFFLLGLLWDMDLTPLDRDAPGNAVLSRSINQACVASARKAIGEIGADPDSAAMSAKVLSYCGCVSVALQREYTREEIARLERDPRQLDKEARFRRIIDNCGKTAAG